jgi:hypothetical protein
MEFQLAEINIKFSGRDPKIFNPVVYCRSRPCLVRDRIFFRSRPILGRHPENIFGRDPQHYFNGYSVIIGHFYSKSFVFNRKCDRDVT